MNKRLMGVFLAILLDMLSFGMFIPDLQLRGQKLVTEALGVPFNSQTTMVGLGIGFSLGMFSLAQLIAAPILGRWSDVAGRKKVLVLSSALSVVAYLLYAHATVLWMVILSRAISGVAASNIGVAFAYAADVTTPKERAKGMGMLGMAFGIGFVMGPPLGALLLRLGNDSPRVLGYVAAALCALNVVYISRSLQETHPEDAAPKPSLMQNAKVALETPGLRLMLVMFFAVNLGFTNLETTYFRLLQDPRTVHHFSESDAKRNGAIILTFVGLVIAFVQGFLIRVAEPKYGAVRLVRFSYVILALSLATVPYTPLWIPTLFGLVFMGLGNGLGGPSIQSLISRAAPMTMQGGIFGITSALGALARFGGPVVSNSLFQLNPAYPYLLGAGVILIPAVLAWRLPLSLGDHQATEDEVLAH